jgi:hypothetical protein
MADEVFSFRWGIPILDGGSTHLPNFILDNYTAAGVTRSEFLAIVHLARYQYEKAGSECRPSLGTVAEKMGYTRRALRKVLAGLEERDLLRRHYRKGDTTVYDFSGFSRAVMGVWLSTGEEPQDLPKKLREERQDLGGEELGDLGGRNPRTHKEEHEEEQQEEEREAAGPDDVVMCSIHDAPMQRREKDGASWHSHRLPDGTWCRGAPGDVRPVSWRDDPDERRRRYGVEGVLS